MQVHGVGARASAASAEKGGAPAIPARPAEGSIETDGPSEVSDGKLRPAHGVLRLLQEGHFHGVADLRLRMNFADEIAALQAEASTESVARGDRPIIDAVNGILEDFLKQDGIEAETAEQLRNAAADFEKAVRDLFSDFDGSKDPEGSALIEALGTAFDNFLAAVHASFPTEDAQPDSAPAAALGSALSTEAAAPTVADAGPDYTSLVEDLTQAFQDAIENLQEQFDAAQVLPPPSGPNGNGAAYDKFLAILNGLNGDSAPAGGPAGVDTAA